MTRSPHTEQPQTYNLLLKVQCTKRYTIWWDMEIKTEIVLFPVWTFTIINHSYM